MNNSMARYEALLDEVERLSGRVFTNREVLLEALLAPGCGVTLAGSRRVPYGHKELALLGDAVMRQLVVEEYYRAGNTRRRAISFVF